MPILIYGLLALRSFSEGGSYTRKSGKLKETLIILANFYNFDNLGKMYYYKFVFFTRQPVLG